MYFRSKLITESCIIHIINNYCPKLKTIRFSGFLHLIRAENLMKASVECAKKYPKTIFHFTLNIFGLSIDLKSFSH